MHTCACVYYMHHYVHVCVHMCICELCVCVPTGECMCAYTYINLGFCVCMCVMYVLCTNVCVCMCFHEVKDSLALKTCSPGLGPHQFIHECLFPIVRAGAHCLLPPSSPPSPPVCEPHGSWRAIGCFTVSADDNLSVLQKRKTSHPRARPLLTPVNHVNL